MSIRITLLSIALFVAIGSCSHAAIFLFQIQYSGAPLLNSATATATLTINDDFLANPGDTSGAVPSSAFPAFTITVQGASSGNGTFSFADNDFAAMRLDTNGGTLDLTQELVGQPTSDNPWGTTQDLTSGDFNIFAASLDAPSANNVFEIVTHDGAGDPMIMVSFTPIPEPTSLGWMLGCCSLLSLSRHRRPRSQSDRS